MREANLRAMLEKGWLKEHEPQRREIENHLRHAATLLESADAKGVAADARFLLVYEAAHAISLAALKLAGYRTGDSDAHRVHALNTIELVLPVRKGFGAALQEANRIRNIATYSGDDVDVPDSLVETLVGGTREAMDETQRVFKQKM